MNRRITDGARWRDRSRHAALVVVLSGAALLAAACSGGGTSSSSAASATADAAYNQALAYSQCMRSHGVAKFPDPSSNGGTNVNGNSLGVSQSVMQAATQACSSLRSGSRSSQNSAQDLAKDLKFTQCMRAHGEPGFPDPNSKGTFSLSGINVQSATFQNALQACQSEMPSNLSLSGSSGNGGQS